MLQLVSRLEMGGVLSNSNQRPATPLTQTQTQIHTHTQTHTHTLIYTHKLTNSHQHTHKHRHAHAHTHTYTHTSFTRHSDTHNTHKNTDHLNLLTAICSSLQTTHFPDIHTRSHVLYLTLTQRHPPSSTPTYPQT